MSYEKKMPKKTYGPKKGMENNRITLLHNEKLWSLCSFPNTINSSYIRMHIKLQYRKHEIHKHS
jgi:hypothetical protein